MGRTRTAAETRFQVDMRHPDLWCLSGSQLQENRSVEVDFEVAAHGHILHGPRIILLGLDMGITRAALPDNTDICEE